MRLRRLQRRRSRGGVALLLVIASIMFMTALVTDISFGARVRFVSATHERDQTQAYWVATSGIQTYRLLLMANAQLNKFLSQNQSMVSAMGLDSMGLTQDLLLTLVPVFSTGFLRMMFVGDGEMEEEDVQAFAQTGEVSDEVREASMEGGSRFGKKNFLDFDGDFLVTSRAEDCRINLNRLSTIASGASIQDNYIAQEIGGLLDGQENEEFLRDRNLTADRLIANIVDWVDADNTSADPTRGGYEDDLYNRLESPYVAKNAPFSTPDEVRLVDGWQDDVYDRFGKQLTIFGSGKVNILCADDDVVKALLKAYSSACATDSQCEQAMQNFKQSTAEMIPASVESWLQAWEQSGVTFNTDIKKQLAAKSTVYTLVSSGEVGDARATITAVVDQSGSDFGRIIYWRVD